MQFEWRNNKKKWRFVVVSLLLSSNPSCNCFHRDLTAKRDSQAPIQFFGLIFPHSFVLFRLRHTKCLGKHYFIVHKLQQPLAYSTCNHHHRQRTTFTVAHFLHLFVLFFSVDLLVFFHIPFLQFLVSTDVLVFPGHKGGSVLGFIVTIKIMNSFVCLFY